MSASRAQSLRSTYSAGPLIDEIVEIARNHLDRGRPTDAFAALTLGYRGATSTTAGTDVLAASVEADPTLWWQAARVAWCGRSVAGRFRALAVIVRVMTSRPFAE